MRGILASQQEQEATTVKELPFPGGPHTLSPTCPSLRASQDSCLRSESSGCNPFACGHPGKHHPSGEPLYCTAKEAVSPPSHPPPPTPRATSQAPSLRVASGSLRLPSRPPPPARSEQRPPLPAPTPPRALFKAPPPPGAVQQGSRGRRSGRLASPPPPGLPAGRR